MNLHRTRELWELYARDGNLTSLASLRTEIAESWGRCRQLQVPIRIDCLRRVTLDEVENAGVGNLNSPYQHCPISTSFTNY